MIMYPWRLLGRGPTEPTPFTGARADPPQARNEEQHSIRSRPHEDRYSAWFKWLRRRSQRTRLTWERSQDLLTGLPSSPSTDRRSDLGAVTREPSQRGAGWSKWASPVLARASAG